MDYRAAATQNLKATKPSGGAPPTPAAKGGKAHVTLSTTVNKSSTKTPPSSSSPTMSLHGAPSATASTPKDSVLQAKPSPAANDAVSSPTQVPSRAPATGASVPVPKANAATARKSQPMSYSSVVAPVASKSTTPAAAALPVSGTRNQAPTTSAPRADPDPVASTAKASAETGAVVSPASSTAGYDWLVGLRVALTTADNAQRTGLIYVYDPLLHCVALIADVSPEERTRLTSDVGGSPVVNGSSGTPKTALMMPPPSLSAVASSADQLPPPTHQRNVLKNLQGKKIDIIKVRHIKSVKVLGSAQSVNGAPGPSLFGAHAEPHPINVEKVKQQLQQGMKETESNVLKIGVGVTKEAQAIFNALSKT
ncbi:hypothetical protein H4R34_005181 [Dimargaris verticillata]|uniref:AD domain-containing protein n=1 Tax=Dimargaris verticillata TaxID=2761393 RepID=A0A9W8AYP5_9FUNG|nr:hypothetical protein H4R34_005181 [Dimargaris verticillata]